MATKLRTEGRINYAQVAAESTISAGPEPDPRPGRPIDPSAGPPNRPPKQAPQRAPKQALSSTPRRAPGSRLSVVGRARGTEELPLRRVRGVGSQQVGAASRVRRSDCAAAPGAMAAWSPESRTSGTAQPAELGRPGVVRVLEPAPAREGLLHGRLALADHPGSSRDTASMITAAATSPPDST